LSAPRRWLRRALVSALAGSGLTTAGLSGLTGGALGATTSTESQPTETTPTGTQPTPPTSSTPTNTTTAQTPTSSTPAPPPATTSTESQPATTQTSTESVPSTTAQTPPPAIAHQQPQKQSAGQQTTSTTPVAPPPVTTTLAAPSGAQGNVAPAPEQVAGRVGALSALLANTTVSAKALQYFQVPLFLLPIYQAAAIQYGVPWEILAAINEVETNYGTDLSVSTAGAVGWMQFMPQTWLQYGVDALDAGYADPYNPVDAIFAAARYLRAAGAANSLRGAVFAYNHSQAYVESVMLRARLLASYPQSVLATLTGLTEGSVPVTGAQPKPSDAAIAGATQTQPPALAPAPSVSADGALGHSPDFVELLATGGAPVIAVEDGRVLTLGHSKELGRYLTMRDVYGDIFTYADLGSVVPSFRVPKANKLEVPQSVRVGAQTSRERAPKVPASAGHQPSTIAPSAPSTPAAQAPSTPPGKVRLFAHPDNPDAIAAMARSSSNVPRGRLALRVGSVLPQGTVIGYLAQGSGARLRFAIRPAEDSSTIDPQPILENWSQLNTALHPQGAKDKSGLIGATADDVFLLTHGELQRAVLSDPGITLSSCDRGEIASGSTQGDVMAALLFLSRSGLKPTVSALRCNHGKYSSNGSISPFYAGAALEISEINGTPIARHQGAGSITDITIRTLLTLQGQFAPSRIVSLMRYPGAHSTVARPDHGAYIELQFPPANAAAIDPATMAVASAATHGKHAPAPAAAVSGTLSSTQWNRLVTRIGSLPAPKIPTKPSKWAIRDHR
jgi:soluble lytic murein transglycosylase-like protein